MDSKTSSATTGATPLTEAALCAWIGRAAPGDTVIYHRGALARQICPQLHLLAEDERLRLAKLAARARHLADAGLAHLVQRRHGFEDFSYVLIVRPRPRIAAYPIPSRRLAEAA